MNSSGFLIVMLCVFVIPTFVGGAILFFLILWRKGKVIGKNMTVISAILFLATIILSAVYQYLGVIGTFTLDHFLYFSWAAGAALSMLFLFIQ